ncbi:MAG: VanZ family protein [Acutalibacteraceae bacterium]
MTVLPGQRLTIGQLFVSLAAGLMFFLLPNDARNSFESPTRESMIFIVSVAITAGLLIIVRRYEAVGAAMITSSCLCLSNYIITEISRACADGDYWPSVSQYQLLSWIILCITPLLTTIFVRLLASGIWYTPEKRRGFSRFLALSLRACMIIYVPILIIKMFIPTEVNFELPRNFDLVPLQHIIACVTGVYNDGWLYLAKNLLILMPVGFYLAVAVNHIRWWQFGLLGLSIGLTIEIIQLSLNTALFCIDDLILYVVGILVGAGIKYLFDIFRNLLTEGKEKKMLYILESS